MVKKSKKSAPTAKKPSAVARPKAHRAARPTKLTVRTAARPVKKTAKKTAKTAVGKSSAKKPATRLVRGKVAPKTP
jgi:hypothetical protein